jgi:hypothetical protein
MRNVRGLATRIDLVIAAAAVAASILVALTIHRTFRLSSCQIAPCPRTAGYPWTVRLAVVAAGLAVAGLVIAIRSYTHRGRA